MAPENTIAAILAAIKAGVDGIEFDIRITADNAIVLCHDGSLLRTFGINQKISDSTLEDLKKLTGAEGKTIPTLEEVLKICPGVDLVIEGKGSNWAVVLAKQLLNYPNKKQLAVISFNHIELSNFGQKCPGIRLYALENQSPLDAINTARLFDFDGIDVNHWTLNPLVYWLARHHKLDIVVYTVNRPWMARFLRLLYPKIAITTDVPQLMQFLRAKPKLVRSKVKSRQ